MKNTTRTNTNPKTTIEKNARTKKTTKADLNGAIKSTGQIDKFRYGILLASEDDTDLMADDNKTYNQVGRDFGVFRLLYENTDNGDTRGLGFISTTVAKPETDSVVNAADFHYLSESGIWKADGQYILSKTHEDGSGKGGFFDIVYLNKQLILYLFHPHNIYHQNMEIQCVSILN